MEKALEKASEQIMADEATLWYCTKWCASPEEREQGKIIALEIEDSHQTYGGLLLRPDSEYLDVFRHYALKGFESGIFKRIQLTYVGEPPIKIGLTEPEPLGLNNVMSGIYILAAFVSFSVVILIAEILIHKFTAAKSQGNEVKCHSSK